MTREDIHGAARDGSRVALVTCAIFPDLYEDEFPLRDALRARGVTVESPLWDDPATDWAAYDLAVLRSTWDYPARREEFVAWAHTVPALANPAGVVEWNTDKHYLRELAAAGVPVTPTTFVEPGESWTPVSTGEWVVKPTISAGSRDTGRYSFPAEAGLAVEHVARLHEAGRTAMVQPFLAAVDGVGETALLYTPGPDGGALGFSHAIRKGPLLSGPDRGDKQAEYNEEISPRTPGEAELAVGERVVAALPAGLLYARVDLIPGPDGAPLLVEVELTEPSLFWTHADGSAERMADAIVARLKLTPR
ncbi:RimK family alpha-L-glutamate ligase [Actinoplanes sp. NPDC049265]|uniref:ATP-grasp domain-containing protein n=1 Tax=Actinoplanes sp. NPDC049265 TaxID=3363902 RepID=UPI003715108C